MDYTQYTDEDLVEMFQKGETGREDKNYIMTYLLEKYKPLVRKVSNTYYLVGGDQNDLIQEGMIAMYEAINTYEHKKHPSFLVYAKNCIRTNLIDAIRKAGTEKNRMLNEAVSLTMDEDEDGFRMEEFLVGDADIPEKIFFAETERRIFLENLQNRLSKLEKQVLMLFLNGRTYTEIAAELEKSPKSIDNALQRIKQKSMEVRAEE